MIAPVGKASRKSSERRAAPEFEQKLAEQLTRLRRHAAAYDAEEPAFALDLAVCIRVLLHSTTHSHALLWELRPEDSTRFVDSAWHIDPTNLIPSHNGLVTMGFSGDGPLPWAPRLWSAANVSNPRLRFPIWWKSIVVRDESRCTWTRERVVLDLANKEGGAHVDPSSDSTLRALEQEGSMGWVHVSNGLETPFLSSLLRPSARQIAHEVIETIELEFPKLREQRPRTSVSAFVVARP